MITLKLDTLVYGKRVKFSVDINEKDPMFWFWDETSAAYHSERAELERRYHMDALEAEHGKFEELKHDLKYRLEPLSESATDIYAERECDDILHNRAFTNYDELN